MKVYMLRHGQIKANTTYTYCGVTDEPLTDEGIEQLKSLKAKGGYPSAEGLEIYTSGLARTEQTLQVLYGDIPHSVEPAFREMNFGAFEGFSYDQLKDREDYQAWISGDHMANRCPGGESGNDMKARVLAGLKKLLERGKDCLVVCHGGTIANVFNEYFPNSGLNWYEIQPSNGTGYCFTFDGSKALNWERIPHAM